MSNADIRSAVRPDWDQVLLDIADYVCDLLENSERRTELGRCGRAMG